jgi:modulator of FtsH protease
MMSSALAPWASFFETGAQTAATLTGLIIVAISVNVQRILTHKHLPARAFAALTAMVVVLTASLSALAPQPLLAFAIEMDAIAAVALTVHIITYRRYLSGHIEAGRPRGERMFSVALAQAQVLPLILGAGLLTFGRPSGLYYIAAALVISVIAAVIDSWVLLVEILRR